MSKFSKHNQPSFSKSSIHAMATKQKIILYDPRHDQMFEEHIEQVMNFINHISMIYAPRAVAT
jgi:hypothetical protein